MNKYILFEIIFLIFCDDPIKVVLQISRLFSAFWSLYFFLMLWGVLEGLNGPGGLQERSNNAVLQQPVSPSWAVVGLSVFRLFCLLLDPGPPPVCPAVFRPASFSQFTFTLRNWLERDRATSADGECKPADRYAHFLH